MSLVSPTELLLASLLEHSATDPANGCPLESVVEEITGGGDRLSKQMEVAVAVEQLIQDDILERETQGSELLFLSEGGVSRAESARKTLAETEVTVVDGTESEQMTVAELATELGKSIVHVGAHCSEHAEYYHEEGQRDEKIIDRERERERWSEVLDSVESDERGALVLVEGPGGIGKTTLGDSLTDTTPAKVNVFQTRCQRGSTGPFQPLRDLLESVEGTNPLDSAGPGGAPEVATNVDEIDAYDAQRTALFHDITEALVPADEQTVLFVDDIGRVDEATQSYLAYLLDRLGDLPVVVLGTHRPGTIAEESVLASGSVPDCVPVTRLELDRFDRSETAKLVEYTTGHRGVPDEFVDAVYEKTSGTPMFVKSTVEALLDSGQLDPQYQWYPDSATSIDLPDAVQQTVSRRIDALDEQSREILRWLSLSGDAVPTSVLAELVDGAPQQVTRSIDILVDAAVLDQMGDNSAVSLRSNVVREALLAEIDEHSRRHEALATRLTEHAETATDSDGIELERATTIAQHYERGDDDENAIEWYERAIAQAEEIYAHETAIDHYHRLLDIARNHDRGTVLSAGEGLAELHLTLGEYDQASQYVQFVRERLEPEETRRRQRLATLAANVADAQTNFEQARTEIEEALAIDDEPTEERSKLLILRADHELRGSEFEAAAQTIAEAFDIAERLDTPEIRARCISYRGLLADTKSEYDEAKEEYEAALSLYETEESTHNAAHIHNALGNLVRKQGQFDAARSYHESARQTHEEVGDKPSVALTLNNLGLVAWRQSDYDAAREYFEESIELFIQLQDEYNIARSRHNLANVFREQGEYDRAETLYDEALPVLEQGGNHMVGIASHDIGKLANRRGEYETAREYCERALEIYEENNHSHHTSAVQNVLGRISTNLGEYESALQYFDTATELATEVGNDALLGKIHANWAAFDAEYGDGQQAREHANRALEYLEDGKNMWFIGRVHLVRAQVALDETEFQSATEHAQQALEAFESVGAVHGTARATAMCGRIAHQRGDVKAAQEYYDSARDSFESIGAIGDLLDLLQATVELCAGTGDETQRREYCTEAIEQCHATDSETLAGRQSWFEDRLATPQE
jgi:tetratricopeptide (TPR) repeat protein